MALPFPRTVVRVSQVTRDEVEGDRKVANLFWSQSYEFNFASNEKSISFSFSS